MNKAEIHKLWKKAMFILEVISRCYYYQQVIVPYFKKEVKVAKFV